MSKKRKNSKIPQPSIEVIWAVSTLLGLIIGFICGCLYQPFGGIFEKLYFLLLFTIAGAITGFAVPVFGALLELGIKIIIAYVHDFIQSVRGS